ncbi:phage tail spike protein [Hominenteromicrobium sp.]|uniref:phage tail spike protein n=1 Tax=Hominenteromicrobium sp. TaxID=3073581 RepID=UPI003A90117D
MFKITAQNRSGITYTLYDPRSSDLKLISPTCKTAVNKAGLLTFSVPLTHPHTDKIAKLDTVVTLWQDDAILFRGRALNDEWDLRSTRKIEVEGELAYLNDSVQPLTVYHDMTVAAYFAKLIELHNAQVDESRRFTVGQITVTNSTDNVYRQSDYESTMDALQDKLLDRMGGYLVIRYGEDGTRYLDYLKEYGNVNSQRITASTNLLDMLHTVRGEDVATAIIPLGAQLDEDKVGTVTPRLTIAAANDGKDYIYDADAVAKWGWIYKVVVHNDITLVENLLRASYADLEAAKYLQGSIEVDAVDLHLVDSSVERIKLGDMILFSAPDSATPISMLVSEIDLPVDEPGDTTYTLGTSYQSLTEKQINARKDLGEQLELVRDETNKRTDKVRQELTDYKVDARKDMDSITASVTETRTELTTTTENVYDALGRLQDTAVSTEELESVKQLLITQWSDQLEYRFTQVTNLIDSTNGTIAENQRLLEQYIRFEGARITLGRSDSAIQAVLSNDRLEFVENGQTIAYISNRMLYITDAHITGSLSFGNADTGLYMWRYNAEADTFDLEFEGDD